MHRSLQVDELFRQQPGYLPVNDLVIGYGCKDLAVPVFADFDTTTDHDWGWKDGIGEHVEFYDTAYRTFYRRSMSGRTHYCLKIAGKEKSFRATPLKSAIVGSPSRQKGE